LPIDDCKLPIADAVHPQIDNRQWRQQSPINNLQSSIDDRQ
jgi:hypothetical protein